MTYEPKCQADQELGTVQTAIWELIPRLPLPPSAISVGCINVGAQVGLASGVPPHIVVDYLRRLADLIDSDAARGDSPQLYGVQPVGNA